MSEYYDELISDAFDEFAVAAGPAVKADGPAAVRATAVHRRKVRVTTFSVLGAVLIALPIAAFAANPRGNNGPPGLDVAHPGSSSPQAPLPSAQPSIVAPSRLIDQIVAVKPKVPAGSPCPQGEGEFRSEYRDSGDYVPGTDALLRTAVQANLDADPAWEIAALAVCVPANSAGDTLSSFVLGFDRIAQGGLVALDGFLEVAKEEQIVRIGTREQGGFHAMIGVDNYHAPVDVDLRSQMREFVWDGAEFTQVGGPASFPAVPKVDLRLTATELELGPPADGKRSGTITVTVRNDGPLPSGEIQVWVIQGDRDVLVNPAAWVGAFRPFAYWPFPHRAIQPGETITSIVTVAVDEQATPGTTMSQVTVVTYTGGADPDFSNNSVVILE